MDGLSLVKQPLDTRYGDQTINELNNDKDYLIALPYNFLNGQRLGLTLQNYDIVDQAFLMPMLKEYLTNNMNLDLDGLLDSFRFEIL